MRYSSRTSVSVEWTILYAVSVITIRQPGKFCAARENISSMLLSDMIADWSVSVNSLAFSKRQSISSATSERSLSFLITIEFSMPPHFS